MDEPHGNKMPVLTKPKPSEEKTSAFIMFANWVSEVMGRPLNITFWLVLVVVWTCVFAFGGSHLASGTWLPSWFTSTGFNFPLNLITTVAELFIGFLVAAATNRAQDALTNLLNHIKQGLENDSAIEQNLTQLMEENTNLTKEVRDLTLVIHDLLKSEKQ